MSTLDWGIIVAYMVGMVALSVYLGRGQENDEDYYVGGRNLPWWAVGISTMATQTSVISFISIPAFVALKEGGGLTWLQYELAVPLAMIVVMVCLLPFFRKLELVSVYAYLEMRFGPSVRYFLSAVFLLSRGLGTGVGIYASAKVLQVCLGIELWQTIVIIGVVTVVYDTIGGMTAVVYSDVIQMAVLLGGLVACIWLAVDEVGGVGAVMEALPAERWRGYDPGTGIFDGSQAPFWGFLIGGLCLYISYYGVDQSQAQRELSAPTMADTRRALVFNGIARFPLTLLYLALGVALGAAYINAPDMQAAVGGDPDNLVTWFILNRLPEGLRAVLLAAMLAAAMSSLDSALNSLSAATMQDFIEKLHPLKPEQRLSVGRMTTIVWGAIITASAFLFGGQDTIVEVINKVGSAFYGPILAAFLVGLFSRRANAFGVLGGVVAGVGFNVFLWLAFEDDLYWMWWNVTGLFVTVVATNLLSYMRPPVPKAQADAYTLSLSGVLAEERKWLGTHALLFGYFIFILVCTLYVETLAS
ncbi:MAG: sodium:solute symporter family transporter [Bradymonadia bacterium]